MQRYLRLRQFCTCSKFSGPTTRCWTPLLKASPKADARVSPISLQLISSSVRFGKESEGMGDCRTAAMDAYCVSSFLAWIQRLCKLLDSCKGETRYLLFANLRTSYFVGLGTRKIKSSWIDAPDSRHSYLSRMMHILVLSDRIAIVTAN
jgi:hypothetical protein